MSRGWRIALAVIALAALARLGVWVLARVSETSRALGHVTGQGYRPAPEACTFGAREADVQVRVTGLADCASQAAALARDGQFWYQLAALSPAGAPGQADGETMFRVCQLTRGPQILTVMDAGGASYGTGICSANEQAGWSEQP